LRWDAALAVTQLPSWLVRFDSWTPHSKTHFWRTTMKKKRRR
jgi:hypothetical protein